VQTTFQQEKAQRLDHFLVGFLPEFSRSRLRALIRDGRCWSMGTGTKSREAARGGIAGAGAHPAACPGELIPEEIARYHL
jgi:23S rRNA-/tRNA-specific pseudouridylate synthase